MKQKAYLALTRDNNALLIVVARNLHDAASKARPMFGDDFVWMYRLKTFAFSGKTIWAKYRNLRKAA